jgi:enamine deaminase RidA (YjgF/YER057c/UK114 family)
VTGALTWILGPGLTSSGSECTRYEKIRKPDNGTSRGVVGSLRDRVVRNSTEALDLRVQDRIERRLTELKIELPALTPPAANYVPFVISGNLMMISGQRPAPIDRPIAAGKVGEGVSVEDAYFLARAAGVRVLAVAKLGLGSLDRISRILKVVVYVNSAPTFTQHSRVANGCSDLLVELLGKAGEHARTSVGANSLPDGILIEVDAMIELFP